MLQLAPFKTIKLKHRAFWLRRSASQSLFAAASDDGDISVCRLESGTAFRLRSAGEKLNAISLHPSRPVLAVVGGPGTLKILGVDGSVHAEVGSGFDDCFFDDDGKGLWCSARISHEEIEVQLRETKGWSVVATTVVEDPFGESSASFHPGVDGEVTALLIATASRYAG